MRWLLVWKTLTEGDETSVKAKARLVVKGFTGPDLTTLRAEAPTLSKQARHMILQLGGSPAQPCVVLELGAQPVKVGDSGGLPTDEAGFAFFAE